MQHIIHLMSAQTWCVWSAYELSLEPSITHSYFLCECTQLLYKCLKQEWLLAFQNKTRSKHMKDSKERLFIMTQTHKLQTFGVIPFIKLQNDTWTTVKRLKMMKNEMRKEMTWFLDLKPSKTMCYQSALAIFVLTSNGGHFTTHWHSATVILIACVSVEFWKYAQLKNV